MNQSLLDSLSRYVHERVPPGEGSFLEAVLENNLAQSFGRADDKNIEMIPTIIRYIWYNLPSRCWGSPAKVKAWLEREETP